MDIMLATAGAAVNIFNISWQWMFGSSKFQIDKLGVSPHQTHLPETNIEIRTELTRGQPMELAGAAQGHCPRPPTGPQQPLAGAARGQGGWDRVCSRPEIRGFGSTQATPWSAGKEPSRPAANLGKPPLQEANWARRVTGSGGLGLM